MLRQALGRAARALSSAGLRAEHTAAAQALADLPLPASDPCMRPYYDQVARMQVVPAASPSEVSESERAVRCRLLPLPPPTCVLLLPCCHPATTALLKCSQMWLA